MRIACLMVVLALALAVPAEAQGNSNKNSQARGQSAETTTVAFGAIAEREIRNYFQSNPLTPQSLPPGIAKNLARGKPLPPGIAKRALPSALHGRLPTYPGHEVVIVDRDVFLVNVATQIVVDILTRVL